MRAGLTSTLIEQMRRADPKVRPMVEALTIDAEDVMRTYDQWGDADNLAAFTQLGNGGVKLTGSFATAVEHLNQDGYYEDIIPAATRSVVHISSMDFTRISSIRRLSFYLHANVDAGGKEVEQWRLRFWHVKKITIIHDYDTTYEKLDLVQIGSEVIDDSPAANDEFVAFTVDLAGLNPLTEGWTLGTSMERCNIFAEITALKASGGAGNAGLGFDSGEDSKTTNSTTIRTVSLDYGDTRLGDVYTHGGALKLAYCKVETGSYSNQTVSFSDAGTDVLDLGAVPSNTVEFVGRGEVPGGTALTYEVRKDNDTAWVMFTDGQTSDDLDGVGKTQEYEMRANLVTNADSNMTPIVRELGVRELVRTDLDGLVQVRGPRWSVDPITLKGEIGEVHLIGIRDGERDFADAMTVLMSNNDIGDILFRVYMGHPDLARGDWLHIDNFLIDDYTPSPASIDVVGVTALSQVRQAIPVPQFLEVTGTNIAFVDSNPDTITRAAGSFITSGWIAGDPVVASGSLGSDGTFTVAPGGVAAGTLTLIDADAVVAAGAAANITLSAVVRRPFVQQDVTLKAAYAEILDSQLALGGRYRGPGVEDETADYKVSNRVTDSDAKIELDAIAFLAGGGDISSQGVIKFVDMHSSESIQAVFPTEEIDVVGVLPGFRQRMPETFVPYDYEAEKDREGFRGEVRGFNAVALASLGRAYIEPRKLDERIARWIETETHAQLIADRRVRILGTGLIFWTFRSTYMHPELEPGDFVAVQTDMFVAKDPFIARAIKGHTWGLGVVSYVEGVEGQEFGIWIRGYSDILTGYENIDLHPLGPPQIEAYFRPVRNNPGQVQVRLQMWPVGATAEYVIQDVGATEPPIGDALYQTYTQEFNVGQLETSDRQLSAYAEHNGAASAVRTWRIDKDTAPEVSLVLSEPVANTVRFSWTADDDVVYVLLYHEDHTGTPHAGDGEVWPVVNTGNNISVSSITSDGTTATVTTATNHNFVTDDLVWMQGADQADYNGPYKVTITNATVFTYTHTGVPATPATGTILTAATYMNESEFVGTIYVTADGGAWDNTGAPLANMLRGTGIGGTIYDDAGHAPVDSVTGVLIPFDRNGNAGKRASAAYTMGDAAAAGNITSFWGQVTRVGSACGTPAQITVTWVSDANVADGTHDLKIYRRRDGSDWNLVKTEASPELGSTQTYVNDVDDYEQVGSGTFYAWDFKFELVLDAGGAVVDSGQFDKPITIEMTGTCPLSD